MILSAAGTAQMTLNVQSTRFTGLYGNALLAKAGETADSTANVIVNVLNSTFDNATMNGSNNLAIQALQNSRAQFNLTGNTFDNIGLSPWRTSASLTYRRPTAAS